MQIYLGLNLDDSALPLPAHSTAGEQHLGPRRLLQTLEAFLGLSYPADDIDYLRIEQYRQVLLRHQAHQPGAFYAAAFAADELATAEELLSRRDELLSAGWDFRASADTPSRLRCLSELEALLHDPMADLQLSAGFADRLEAVLAALLHRRHPLQAIVVHEPAHLLPPALRRLLAALAATGTAVTHRPEPDLPDEDTDLAAFRRVVLRGRGATPPVLKNDGSLLVLRARRETHIAAYLARLLHRNPHWRPACLLTVQNRTLDNALIMEGLPSLGVPSASLARPTLQVLKLVTAFLWEPIEVHKLMEFVSLGVKPLDPKLANRIAGFLAQKPGLYSDGWFSVVLSYLEEVEKREGTQQAERIRRQYDFWFAPRRYDSQGTAPKERVRDIFAYLQRWARQTFDEDGEQNKSLLVLAEQARRITELLDALPEAELTYLQVERIVRTIYEPAPVHFQEAQVGRLAPVFHPAAISGPVPELVWWDFVQGDPDYFFSRWYPPELAWLQQQGTEPESPAVQNERLVWQRRRPVLHTTDRLVLCLPELVDGTAVQPHPLYGDLLAAFGNLNPITLYIDDQQGRELWASHFELPRLESTPVQTLGRPRPFFTVGRAEKLAAREGETPSSLQDLLYYPYQWVLRHKIRLRKSSILSVVDDYNLMGNLAHSFIEQLLAEWEGNWSRQEAERWIDRQAGDILRKEGATLLLYGREPERVAFLNRLKYAAWSLLDYLQKNNWLVVKTEMDVEGRFAEVAIKGRADLVLQRGEEYAVIDLKWRGARRYEERIRNEEDLQLVLYANYLAPGDSWAHSAYFIMDKGRMIARNEHAFRGIEAVAPQLDHREVCRRVFDKMSATYAWRRRQLEQGRVEVRCKQTCEELEEEYGRELMDLLEMRSEDAPFDEYRTLINLIE